MCDTQSQRQPGETIGEMMNRASECPEVGEYFIVQHRNFDPTTMQDIQIVSMRQACAHDKFVELLRQGYLCHGIYLMRDVEGIHDDNYSTHFEMIMTKAKPAE